MLNDPLWLDPLAGTAWEVRCELSDPQPGQLLAAMWVPTVNYIIKSLFIMIHCDLISKENIMLALQRLVLSSLE